MRTIRIKDKSTKEELMILSVPSYLHSGRIDKCIEIAARNEEDECNKLKELIILIDPAAKQIELEEYYL